MPIVWGLFLFRVSSFWSREYQFRWKRSCQLFQPWVTHSFPFDTPLCLYCYSQPASIWLCYTFQGRPFCSTYNIFQIFEIADRLKCCLSRISQECEQWIKPQFSSSSPSSSLAFTNTVHSLADVTPSSPLNTTSGHVSGISFSLKVHSGESED